MTAGDFSLSELELFTQIARTASLREVARHNSMNPAHVSKVLKRLETKAGRSLVKRSVSGAVLTAEGVEFAKTARAIVELSAQFQVRRGSASARKSPRLIGLASMSYMNTHLLPECLAALTREEPELSFRLADMAGESLVTAGIKGAFEIALHVDDLDWPKTWHTREAGTIEWGLFGNGQHPLAPRARLQDLKRFSFVVPCYWNKQGFTFGNDRCPFPMSDRIHGYQVSTAETALQIVQHTDQLTFVPKIVAQRSVQLRQLAEIQIEEWKPVTETVFISVRSDRVQQKLLNRLAQELKKKL